MKIKELAAKATLGTMNGIKFTVNGIAEGTMYGAIGITYGLSKVYGFVNYVANEVKEEIEEMEYEKSLAQ